MCHRDCNSDSLIEHFESFYAMSFPGDKQHNMEHDGPYLHTNYRYSPKQFSAPPTAQQLAQIYTPTPDDNHFWPFPQRNGAQVVPNGPADQSSDNWPLEQFDMLQHDISRSKRRRIDPRGMILCSLKRQLWLLNWVQILSCALCSILCLMKESLVVPPLCAVSVVCSLSLHPRLCVPA